MDQINKIVISDPYSDSKLANVVESSSVPWKFWIMAFSPTWWPLEVSMDWWVDSGNSTSTPLSWWWTWTGTIKDINEYNNIIVSVYSNVASATDWFVIEWSADWNTFYWNDVYTISAWAQKTFTFQRCARYYRVRYTNWGSAQSTFVLTTWLSKLYMKGSSHRVADSVSLQDDAELMKAIISWETTAWGGSFVNVKVNPSWAIQVWWNVAWDDTDDSAFTVANDKWLVVMWVATSDTVDANDKWALAMTTRRELKVWIFDSVGNQVSSFWSPSTIADYKSPTDFTVAYTSASTITLSNLPFAITDNSQLVYIKVIPSSTNSDAVVYVNWSWWYTFRIDSSNVITAYKTGATTNIFTSGDVYEVWVNQQVKTIDITTDTQKITTQNPDPSYYSQWEWVDTTNVTAATTYYPSSLWVAMDQYKHMSLTGKFIDADNKIVMTVEATNDEDQTNADRVQVYCTRNWNNALEENQWTASNGTLTFALTFQDFNFQYFRVKVVNLDNTNTCIIKIRQLY